MQEVQIHFHEDTLLMNACSVPVEYVFVEVMTNSARKQISQSPVICKTEIKKYIRLASKQSAGWDVYLFKTATQQHIILQNYYEILHQEMKAP